MMSAPAPSTPVVGERSVKFRLRDPDEAFTAVGLMQELRRPRDWTPLVKAPDSDVWSVEFPRLRVARMEYQFNVVRADGSTAVICDPENPLRAPGAFGEKSVLEFPEYERPGWLAPEHVEGHVFSTHLGSRALDADLALRIWTSPGADIEEPLPVLVAHDGGEYAELSSLLVFLERMVADGRLPSMHAVLVEPPWPRDEHYSASALYARALVSDVLPAMEWLAPTPAEPPSIVGMGASLGALAMLHAHRIRPQGFAGLYLQSGSFFRQRYDKHETGFPRFRRISRFVGEVLHAASFPNPIPMTLTCGAVEENLANNRAVAAALERQGYPVTMVVTPDAHNYVGWRDTFDPHLVDLLAKVWHRP